MTIAERWRIEAILALARQIDLNTLYIPCRKDPTSKTSICMRVLGYTPSDVLEVIHSLEVRHYSEGPKRDDKGRPHDLWVFGKFVEGKLIYIKLAVFYDNDAIVGICVSFHEPEWEMAFPYEGVR